MFHKTGRGKDLTEFLLGLTANSASVVKQQGAGTGCPLVQGKNEAHGS
jgi:hypothetical protein